MVTPCRWACEGLWLGEDEGGLEALPKTKLWGAAGRGDVDWLIVMLDVRGEENGVDGDDDDDEQDGEVIVNAALVGREGLMAGLREGRGDWDWLGDDGWEMGTPEQGGNGGLLEGGKEGLLQGGKGVLV